ncbi:DUF956 family protein [Streptococcaceae bacterium ESL0729]|nr:DUF956 family protein [Streptococcaceae bacterium ESL0729]
MVQSLNTKAEYSGPAIAYLGFAKYGKVLLGDQAFEFFNDRRLKDNIVLPWAQIKKIEGYVSRGKVDRRFNIILNNNSSISFSSKDSGHILKIAREHLGNDKVVRGQTFLATILSAFKRKNR